jgi:mRNA interferase MazF
MTKNIQRGEIWLVDLEPTKGDEIKKTRPCVVLSSDQYRILLLRIVAPITEWDTRYSKFPWFVHIKRSKTNKLDKESAADCLQIRSISEERFIRKIGNVTPEEMADILAAVQFLLSTP